MKKLSKEDIFNSVDLPREIIEIKEWDGEVTIRGLTGSERDEFEAQIFTGEGKNRKFNHSNLRARLLTLTICDEAGNRIFSDADVEKLGKKSSKIMDKLFAIAQRLSGLGEKDVAELLKNFKPDQPD